MDVLVLYSWEENELKANEWAMALCNELEKYMGIHATCDKLWTPKSDTYNLIKKEISETDRIIVIVSKSYNDKIASKTGMVAIEEELYKDIVEKSKDENKILFVLKEKNIRLPEGWSRNNRVDLSQFNENDYKNLTKKEKDNLIDNVIRFINGIPEYTINRKKTKKIPNSKVVKSFETLFVNPILEKKTTLKEQEKKLIEYLQKNCNQESTVYDYIKSGLAADLNFNGKITPELFSEYFLVKRDENEEVRYNRIIREVFQSVNHNMLCLQSDGGSGKSVFVQTMSQRLEKNSRTRYKYNNIIFDLSNLYENSLSKEELIFQRLKKEYRQMVRSYKSDLAYAHKWLNSFVDVVESLNEVVFNNDGNLFKLNKFQEELNNAISKIILEKSNINESNLESWYFGYSSRISDAKASISESNILFVILLTIYMLILMCKPDEEKDNRYIFVFDNIETYDNGETTKKIATYIQRCHSFIRKIFSELGQQDIFFTKFTFVFVIRTSTRANFGNLQTDLWGGGRYVKTINFYDFTVEALIKKIKFLTKLKDYQNTLLYKELYLIASIIIPSSVINNCLISDTENIIMYKHFTSHRLLPFFNNNYRKAIMYICNVLSTDSIHNDILEKTKAIKSRHDALYDYSINGIRMIIFRFIFNQLQENEYLDVMGFSNLTGNEEHSITRTILSSLYWDEYKYFSSNFSEKYKGITLYSLISMLRDYCCSSNLADILYGLSMYAYKNNSKKEAIEAWGYLLTYTNLNIDLSENEFKDIIKECYAKKQNSIIIQDTEIFLDKIYVKLSDAGMCFEQYYIRNLEFLLSRSKYDHNTPPLFMLEKEEEIESCIQDIYNIIINCIDKLIMRCKGVCMLYGNPKDRCIHKTNDGSKNDHFSCSLFIRYQECVDLIRESIDYIDRFRFVHYNNFKNTAVNNLLLDKLKNFYALYEILYEKVSINSNDKTINEFLPHFNIIDTAYNLNNKKSSYSLFTDKDNIRIERIRPIQSFYVEQNENFGLAISKLRNHPSNTIYQLIEDMC